MLFMVVCIEQCYMYLLCNLLIDITKLLKHKQKCWGINLTPNIMSFLLSILHHFHFYFFPIFVTLGSLCPHLTVHKIFSRIFRLQIHLLAEPFCVILYRQLSNMHPLNELLKYHCRGLIATNTIGSPSLLKSGGYMDQLTPTGHKGTLLLVERGYKTLSWKDADFHLDIKVNKVYTLNCVSSSQKLNCD